MPLLLALALTLVAAVPPSQPPVEEPQTITVLVEKPVGRLSARSDTPTEWARREVPLRGTVAETLSALEEETGRRVAEERTYRLFAPQDEPDFGRQWYLENTGQTGGSTGADIHAASAWEIARGAGVVVAVIDSGVQPDHPEFAGRLHPAGKDYIDGDNDPRPGSITNPDETHGTAVAGVIAAAENGIGISGVAPEATILAIRACSGGGCSNADVANAIVHAVDSGADIINLSLGSIFPGGDPPVEDAIAYARSRDVLVVTAAGNESIDLDDLPPRQVLVPGGLPFSNILNATATDDRDILSDFSNFGPATVDIAAPGEGIYTGVPPAGYSSWSGTSFSAPIVAGVAALLLSHDPGMTHHELVARLKAFVDRPFGVAGATASGRVNAARVLQRRFVDTSGSVFEAAIDELAAKGVTQGCDPPHNIHYCPRNLVTRGQMAAFISRALNLPGTSIDFFTDDNGAFYNNAANRLAAAGITFGCSPTRYCGEQTIPREQMAAMLSRALDLPAAGTDRFRDDEASPFEQAINRVAQAGLTLGCNPPRNDRFCPKDPVTRGQMAAFLKRAIDLINS